MPKIIEVRQNVPLEKRSFILSSEQTASGWLLTILAWQVEDPDISPQVFPCLILTQNPVRGKSWIFFVALCSLIIGQSRELSECCLTTYACFLWHRVTSLFAVWRWPIMHCRVTASIHSSCVMYIRNFWKGSHSQARMCGMLMRVMRSSLSCPPFALFWMSKHRRTFRT